MVGEQAALFKEAMHSCYSNLPESEQKDKVRTSAWDAFLQVGLPTKRNEKYRYVGLQSLYSRSFALSWPSGGTVDWVEEQVLPECQNSYLVYVNGHFLPEASDWSALPAGIVVSTLGEARLKYGSFLRNRSAQWIKSECNPFALLNGALHQEGVFLYLPPNCRVERPIQIISLLESKQNEMMAMPRLQLFAGAQAEVSLIATTASRGEGRCWVNRLVDCVVEEGARVQYTPLLFGMPNTCAFDAVRGVVKRSGSLHLTGITDGCEMVHSDYSVALQGEGAETNLAGGWFARESSQVHTQIHVEHCAPHCTSRQLFKGILDGRARSSFEGKIYVHPEAQKTDAFQLNNNLLLSDSAAANSKPNLEIFADDVKASHGSTMGQLDKESLYYLQSRGMSFALARDLLVRGFLSEITQEIKSAALLSKLKSMLPGAA